jgi:hypothetical protein
LGLADKSIHQGLVKGNLAASRQCQAGLTCDFGRIQLAGRDKPVKTKKKLKLNLSIVSAL